MLHRCFVKKLSKGFVLFSIPLLENSIFLNARFLGTKAEDLKGCVACFLFPLASTVPEDEALCFPSEVSGVEGVLD